MADTQTILVAGATGNVGGGASLALAGRGARVVLLGRNQARLDAKIASFQTALTEAQLTYNDNTFATLVIDFSDMTSVRKVAEEALQRFPQIHGLVLSVVTLAQGGPNILPDGHELMFATNILGPFLFAELLIERLAQSGGMILHVINPSNRKIDWDDLESIKNHQTTPAYERSKVLHRVIAGEMARRYTGQIASVAFNPGFVIDKSDPELDKRWPSGILGFFWRTLALLFSKAPAVAGEPIAEIMLSSPDRLALNGALFKQYKRIQNPDKAMNDREAGERLWLRLVEMSGLAAA